MTFLRAVFHQFRITPLRGHFLSILEGALAFNALQLWASDWHLTGVAVSFLAMILAYTDGRYGWSVGHD